MSLNLGNGYQTKERDLEVELLKKLQDLKYTYRPDIRDKPTYLFSSSVLVVPSEKEEQQRIGDCLSSLDALTDRQTEKLDALKAHKKGLMQQLFPVVENEVGS